MTDYILQTVRTQGMAYAWDFRDTIGETRAIEILEQLRSDGLVDLLIFAKDGSRQPSSEAAKHHHPAASALYVPVDNGDGVDYDARQARYIKVRWFRPEPMTTTVHSH